MRKPEDLEKVATAYKAHREKFTRLKMTEDMKERLAGVARLFMGRIGASEELVREGGGRRDV